MSSVEFTDPDQVLSVGRSIPGHARHRRNSRPHSWVPARSALFVASWLVAAALAVACSFFNVYRSSVTVRSTGSMVGYKYSVDGWGRERFRSFNIDHVHFNLGMNPRFGIVLVATAGLLVVAFAISVIENEPNRILGGLLSMISSGSLLATAAAMLLAKQAASTLGGSDVMVTTALGPCAWCTVIAGLLPPLSCLIVRTLNSHAISGLACGEVRTNQNAAHRL